MGLEKYGLNIFAFVIAMVIFIDGHKIQTQFFAHKIYMIIVRTAMGLLIIDILACVFNDLPGQTYLTLNKAFNLLLYILAIIPVILWMIYADYQVFHDLNRIKKVCYFGVVVFSLNAILSVMSLNYGWFFYVDANNIYHRGEYFWIHVFFCYSTLIYTFIFIMLHHKAVERKYYKSLLLFAVPQFMGSIIQVLYFGVLLNWSCMVISLLFVYLNIQNIRLGTDYLTGAFNRMSFDQYLKEQLKKSSTKYTGFSAILIDIDHFKEMNDTFGHDVGDEVLKDTVTLLSSTLKNEAFIARYGGDEFFIVLDVDNTKMLLEVVDKINKAKDTFNFMKEKQYKINFSMGYAVYNEMPDMGLDEFTKHIDRLMYADKQKNHKKHIQHLQHSINSKGIKNNKSVNKMEY